MPARNRKKRPKRSASPVKRRFWTRHAGQGKPPILGLIQRGGQGVIQMLENVQQATAQPVIQSTIAPGTLI
ncbi:hypothetical protein [Methylobacter luteus]|uniref:hypothetical protein n=1 Tax=Methylobacter luteus TaxID=415 RepID=UPI0009DC46D3|nr:hypothetical protein [Methylobacter luteus]